MFHLSETLLKNFFVIINMYTNVYEMYKPDSKKVGTLYKLWIKKECNNLQIS